ncbi:MAG TPA: SUMF1/EgtB/PvdO family nonheme iron enzyme [Xanthomonadales bacterium]|nr:SUMF1/EgtB/PvdO family nonheme iron enzyme [Xanthomonadales bacterium]
MNEPRTPEESQDSSSGAEWRRRVASETEADAYPAEGREWLPMVLAGMFVAAVLAAAIYLLFYEPDLDGLTPEEALVIGQEEAKLPAPRSTSEERSRWEAALDADTVLAYRRFIEDYPESVYLGQAQIQMDVLDERAWEQLSAEDSLPAYQDYLAQFPNGLHQATALSRIDEIEQQLSQQERERLERERQDNEGWLAARSAGTLSAVEQYIQDWPTGLHIAEASGLRRLLKARAEDDAAFSSAQKLNTRDAYQTYVDAFPQGDHVAEALASMDDLVMRPGKQFADCSECPPLVVIPAGRFEQGSADDAAESLAAEKPARVVNIPRMIAVGIHEVTMDQWDACFTDGGCSRQPGDNGWGRGNRPVIMVSWSDTQEYLQWISDKTGKSYRLPSESEWEYFARAGEQSPWLGGSASALCQYANVAGDESGFEWRHSECSDIVPVGTAPVGSLRPNAFGIHDVIGNVAEWTADCMNLTYLDAPLDGSAWGRGICSSHMTRGGSWLTGSKEIRLPSRFNLRNGDRNDFTGFRVVREIDER